MEVKAPAIMDHNFKPAFRLDLHIKDVMNVLDTAKSLDSPALLTAQVFEMMKIVQSEGICLSSVLDSGYCVQLTTCRCSSSATITAEIILRLSAS